MFNFIKKGVVDKERDKTDRKEKRKKDKKTKDGVSSISSSMSSEELLRLDEVSVQFPFYKFCWTSKYLTFV